MTTIIDLQQDSVELQAIGSEIERYLTNLIRDHNFAEQNLDFHIEVAQDNTYIVHFDNQFSLTSSNPKINFENIDHLVFIENQGSFILSEIYFKTANVQEFHFEGKILRFSEVKSIQLSENDLTLKPQKITGKLDNMYLFEGDHFTLSSDVSAKFSIKFTDNSITLTVLDGDMFLKRSGENDYKAGVKSITYYKGGGIEIIFNGFNVREEPIFCKKILFNQQGNIKSSSIDKKEFSDSELQQLLRTCCTKLDNLLKSLNDSSNQKLIMKLLTTLKDFNEEMVYQDYLKKFASRINLKFNYLNLTELKFYILESLN